MGDAHVSDFQFPWAQGWHFSQAVRAGDVIVTAGCAGFDDDGVLVSDQFEGQFRQAFRNLETVLRTQGSSLDGIMRLNTYLSDPAQYEAFKRIRGEFLTAPYPASTAVVVGFVFPGMLTEIEAIAIRGGVRTPDGPEGPAGRADPADPADPAGQGEAAGS